MLHLFTFQTPIIYDNSALQAELLIYKGDLSVKSNSYLITFKDADPLGSAFEMLKGVKGVKWRFAVHFHFSRVGYHDWYKMLCFIVNHNFFRSFSVGSNMNVFIIHRKDGLFMKKHRCYIVHVF